MHACMYVCMYVCMYACVYVCMYVCVCVCMYMYGMFSVEASIKIILLPCVLFRHVISRQPVCWLEVIMYTSGSRGCDVITLA